ncbi:hypothetical protein U47_46 [Pseudomonas phage U47]|nr:hypothetical protein U47_46 [Pseudomonas phage U47]
MKYRVQQLGKRLFYIQKRFLFMWRTVTDSGGCFMAFYSLEDAEEFIRDNLKYRDSPVYHPVE